MAPKPQPSATEWLRRAKSNLTRAKIYGGIEGVLYEDCCFDAQQAAEKAIKAVLIHLGRSFPKTHSIPDLLTFVESAGLAFPQDIREAAVLTDYAVTTRYPGPAEDIAKEEYDRAVALARRVVDWAEEVINTRPTQQNSSKSTQERKELE
jgi:HEPN domain-containing protein